MMTASFANSDGWKFITPREIQRLAPFTPLPMKGMSTAANKINDTMNKGLAFFSHISRGTWKANNATPNPITIEIT